MSSYLGERFTLDHVFKGQITTCLAMRETLVHAWVHEGLRDWLDEKKKVLEQLRDAKPKDAPNGIWPDSSAMSFEPSFFIACFVNKRHAVRKRLFLPIHL